MKIILNIVVLGLTFLYMPIINGQEDFDPNKLKEEYFQNDKIVNEATFVDKLGNSYKITNTEYLKGVSIKKDGSWQKHGVFYSFSGGRKTGKTTYSYGKKHGECESYFADSKLQFKWNCENDKREGKWYQYREDGTLSREKVYKNDLIEGEEIVYYVSGAKNFVNQYVGGKKHGEWLQYKEDGKLISKTQFNMDEKVGEEYYK